MTTSGVTTFNVTRNDIINMALEDCSAYAPDFQSPSSGQVSRASVRLNAMIKAWQAAGVGLWLNQLCTLPLQQGAQSYLLGPSGAPCSASIGMVETTLTSAASAGSTTISVSSIVGLSSGMNIGIQEDAGLIQWTTISGAPVGTTVTLTAALTGAAASGSAVFAYTSKISRPLQIIEARVKTSAGTETPLYVGSRDEYMSLPLKSSTGTVSQCYYDPQTVNGVLYVWPVDTVMSDRIIFTGRTPIQDFVNTDDTPDFPVEWTDALHFNLAIRLPSALKLPDSEYNRLVSLASVALNDANDFDREWVQAYFTPAMGPGRQ